jgi:hypothetical protein
MDRIITGLPKKGNSEFGNRSQEIYGVFVSLRPLIPIALKKCASKVIIKRNWFFL